MTCGIRSEGKWARMRESDSKVHRLTQDRRHAARWVDHAACIAYAKTIASRLRVRIIEVVDMNSDVVIWSNDPKFVQVVSP